MIYPMTVEGLHYQTREPIRITGEQGRIARIEPLTGPAPDRLIAPAYFDLQINGGLGINFTSPSLTLDEVHLLTAHFESIGIGGYCPTVITSSSETITAAMQTLARAVQRDRFLREMMPAFHLEGPFISAEDGPRGAHPREHVLQPSYRQFQHWQEAAAGNIRLVTLAPELPGALRLIEQLTQDGLVVAIGHSAASVQVIRDAIRSGARLSTHLGNGAARMLPRHDNLIHEQLAADELHASIIPDGHHLPWSLVKIIERCKTPDRLIITCDSSPLAGMQAGEYTLWNTPLVVTKEGSIQLKDQGLLAGSWDFTPVCVEKYCRHLQVNYATAHAMACDHPRRLLELPVTTLEAGQPSRFAYSSPFQGEAGRG
jgi:N-acetylglucosamine-6-phosphate deacetylase